MQWHYVKNGAQIGPVSDDEIRSLSKEGTISSDTLVWNKNLPNWVPFSAIQISVEPAQDAPAAIGAENVRCSECGGYFPADEVITLEGQPVCAGCKPMALQKVRQGVQLKTEMQYAGFWIRFAAKFIDSIILQIISLGTGFLLGAGIAASNTNIGETEINLLGGLIGLVTAAIFNIFFVGKYGATPGKMACKLRIVRPDGEPLSYWRAAGRHFAEYLSSLILLIGYIMAGFDEQKRALHDRIADTRVIRL
jgi:uncharacterized RDD family membrane protein YckC